MTTSPEPTPSVLEAKDTQWLLEQMKEANGKANQHFAWARDPVQALVERMQAKPMESEAAAFLAQGVNLPDVRAQLSGQANWRLAIPGSQQEAQARKLEELKAWVTKTYLHDMRQVEHVQNGYLDESGWKSRQAANMELSLGMNELGTFAHQTMVRMTGRGLLAAQERGDQEAAGTVAFDTKSLQATSGTGLFRNAQDQQAFAKAAEVQAANAKFIDGINRKVQLQDILPHVDAAIKASGELFGAVQGIDSGLKIEAAGPTPGMQRGRVQHGQVGMGPGGVEKQLPDGTKFLTSR